MMNQFKQHIGEHNVSTTLNMNEDKLTAYNLQNISLGIINTDK